MKYVLKDVWSPWHPSDLMSVMENSPWYCAEFEVWDPIETRIHNVRSEIWSNVGEELSQ